MRNVLQVLVSVDSAMREAAKSGTYSRAMIDGWAEKLRKCDAEKLDVELAGYLKRTCIRFETCRIEMVNGTDIERWAVSLESWIKRILREAKTKQSVLAAVA